VASGAAEMKVMSSKIVLFTNGHKWGYFLTTNTKIRIILGKTNSYIND
jgi:hypothetical protein